MPLCWIVQFAKLRWKAYYAIVNIKWSHGPESLSGAWIIKTQLFTSDWVRHQMYPNTNWATVFIVLCLFIFVFVYFQVITWVHAHAHSGEFSITGGRHIHPWSIQQAIQNCLPHGSILHWEQAAHQGGRTYLSQIPCLWRASMRKKYCAIFI